MDVTTLDVSTADFSGWATKAGLECSDGRTILPGAFEHQDGKEVPLVWQHDDSTPENVLGKAVLVHKDDGVYTYAWFNDTPRGQIAKELVHKRNITSLSIRANQLKERGKQVMHGMIRELSLVLSGANPGALIDNVAFAHGDSVTVLEDEAIIYTGLDLEHDDSTGDDSGDSEELTVADVYHTLDDDQRELVHFMIGEALDSVNGEASHSDSSDNLMHEGESDRTAQDVYDSLNSDQRDLVHYMIGEALVAAESDDDVTHSDDQSSESTATESGDSSTDTTDEGDLAHQEGTNMNVFDGNASSAADTSKQLTHSQLVGIVKEAKKPGVTFKDAVLAHAQEYGIEDINLLFPDAKALTETPEFISRRMEWVSKVLGGTKHSPFAKVKTLFADITEPEARAKGYLKGTRKKEEVFKLLKRTTGPATIYKKQKLDRDDVLDITDINVVNWLKAEMRLMIEEELARAVLVGDGRSSLDEDKVKDPEGAVDGNGIRSILHDDPLYVIRRMLPANVTAKDVVKAVVRAQDEYRGTGTPTMFTARGNLTEMLLDEDRYGRPMYANKRELADKLGVDDIVPVDIFPEYEGLYAIIVNLTDYTIGSNRGGELTSFEDFDIDFNQMKYLQETRLSGGLTKPFSAIVIRRELGESATPAGPSFDGTTDVITIPDVEGVEYYNAETDAVYAAGATDPITEATEVRARAEEGYYIPTGSTTSWTFTP